LIVRNGEALDFQEGVSACFVDLMPLEKGGYPSDGDAKVSDASRFDGDRDWFCRDAQNRWSVPEGGIQVVVKREYPEPHARGFSRCC
jgi:hypothetical protein